MRYFGRSCCFTLSLALASCAKLGRQAPSKDDAVKASENNRALANDAAFELVATTGGATLLWAPRERRAAALLALALGPDGAERGAATTVVKSADAAGEISDLGATFRNGELSAAWVERSAGKARLRAVVQREGVVAGVLELGPAWFAPRPARGNLAMATQGEAALVFARGEASACVNATDEACFSFALRRIQQGRAHERGFPLIVPKPCAESSITFAVAGRDLHYGVCTSSNGNPLTTLFTIRAEPEYARADPLLPGCRPLALVELGGSVRLVADCNGHRRAAHVAVANNAVELEDLPSPALECLGERARIRFGAAWFELDAPRAQLQALLPTVIAPRGSRALFTGAALLVAQAKSGKVELSRYACSSGILRQLPRAAH